MNERAITGYYIKEEDGNSIFIFEVVKELGVDGFLSYKYYLVNNEFEISQLDAAEFFKIISSQKKIEKLAADQARILLRFVTIRQNSKTREFTKENNINLELQLSEAREYVSNNYLSEKEEALLNDLENCVKNINADKEWIQNYEKVEFFIFSFHRAKVRDNLKLKNEISKWLSEQRKAYEDKKLTPEQVELLKKTGLFLENPYSDDDYIKSKQMIKAIINKKNNNKI